MELFNFIWHKSKNQAGLDENSEMLWPVKPKDSKNDLQYVFQPDTGAPYSVLFSSSVSGLPIESDRKSTATLSFNIEGMQFRHTFRMIDLRAEQEKKLAEIAEQGKVFLGLLGMDFFAGRTLLIDFPNRLAGIDNALHSPSTPLFKNATNLHAKIKEDRIILPVNFGSYSLQMLYDSGASPVSMIVSYDHWKEITGKNASDRDNLITTLPGVADEFTLVIARSKHPVVVGNLKFSYPLVGFEREDKFYLEAQSFEGIIGNQLFLPDHYLLIDFVNKSVYGDRNSK